MAYLNELHPEVYNISPRPGGIANIKEPKLSRKVRLSVVSEKSSKTTNRSVPGKSSMSGKGSIGGASRGSTRSSKLSAFDVPLMTSTPQKECREFRIKKVLNTSQWMMPDDDDDEDLPMPIRNTDPISSELTILSVVISTIMLMAVQYPDINKDHLRWTLSYLECIKDEHGSTPPNVRGIMNNIKLIDDTLESFLEPDVTDGMLDAATEPAGEEKETGVAEPTA